ncbi:hypothetical protein A3Q56_06745 [Intoshia linei]|uniref:Ras-GEF domain-containing protein n=1 Tax=Intoshia linei TaxID=1819745 RepID=A0A177AUL4_9BILA|nr:hypothetical protein A3Q56_06745 [Intoshia linei]
MYLPLKIFELKNENKNVVLGCESESEKSAWLCYIGIIENQISVVEKETFSLTLKSMDNYIMWLKFYWCDIFNYSSILYKLNEFLKDPFPYKGLNTYRKSILNLIKKLNTSCVDPKICSKVIYNEDFDILKVDSKLFAEQLTLYERKLFTYIPRAEFISILWSNKQKGSNLLRYIQHSTKFTYWIEKIIIETSINVERISVVSKIVDILEELYYINNFNAIFQIIAAFDCSAVYRLINTFSALASNRSKIINKCRLLTLNHYKIYKKRLKYISNPLPFLGIFLSNITFVNASTTTIVKNKETKSIYRLVNLKKCRKISSLISEIVNYQKITNQFNNDPNIQKMLSNIDPVKGKTEKEFENEMYKKSLQIQPRVS